MKPATLFIVGASGVGKTTALEILAARDLSGVQLYHFDSIGVPSVAIMERDFGGGEGWQSDATERWVTRLAATDSDVEVAVLEGQTRPSFIIPALGREGVERARIVLLDCDPRTRAERLAGPREQPELASREMDAWAAYLRGQADALGLKVIDTSQKTPDEVADEIQTEIELTRVERASR